jgi:acyl carrier protein
MVLFGSNAANVGDFGLVDYTAANSFLDAFAYARARHSRVIAIDWGPWREVGMAVTADLPSGLETVRQNDVAARGMAPADALDALDRILRFSSTAQVIVSPTDLKALLANAFSLDSESAEQGAKLAGLMPGVTAHPRPGISTNYTPPRDDTQRRMCEAWQDILGIDRVGIHDSFFDLGGNSLVAIQLMNTISREVRTRLSVADLFESLTVSRLAALIDTAETAGGRAEAELAALAEHKKRAQQRRMSQQRRRDHIGARREWRRLP